MAVPLRGPRLFQPKNADVISAVLKYNVRIEKTASALKLHILVKVTSSAFALQNIACSCFN